MTLSVLGEFPLRELSAIRRVSALANLNEGSDIYNEIVHSDETLAVEQHEQSE